MDDLTREFLIESGEGLDAMERSLTELELRPSDPNLLGEIFRAVHTIKGTTGFLGFRRLESLAHCGENLLGQMREGRITARPEIITLLLRVLDGLRAILNQIEKNGEDGAPDPKMDAVLIAELNYLTGDGKQTANSSASTAEITDTGVKARSRRSTSGRKSKTAVTQLLPVAGDEPQRIVTPATAGMKALPEAENAQADKSAGNDASANVASATSDSTLRVDVELLNRMMNLVGELVLTRNQILQHTSADHRFNTLARRLDMVTADLRESVMRARMQPVSNIFQKFPRMVRDLCYVCEKQVRLEMYGQETELDKSLLEAIKDPLTHALRNAIDHGMETVEERLALGKSAEGTVRLRAYQQASHVVVEVVDDGKGIDPKKILQKAVEKGLLPQERAGELNNREILQLIFLPGFSTAEKVTNVSGRGVGMDVVRTNVEKIGGTVELESTLGNGTIVRLQIPLTLAIVPALVVRSCGETFAIPQSALFELLYVAPDAVDTALEWVGNAPFFRLRESLVPVVRLCELLQLEKPQEMRGRKFFMAVLDADGKRFGLAVDELLDPEEIVVKPLSAVLRQVGLFSGATILGNGSLALILDPAAAAIHANIGLRKLEEVEDMKVQAAVKEPEYLVFDNDRDRDRKHCSALPLELIERIETVAYEQIEYAGHAPVLQYSGSILPLVDEGGLLDEMLQLSNVEAARTAVHILVCHQAGWSAGLVVREVLDVRRGSVIENSELNSMSAGLEGKLARVGGRITVLQGLEQMRMAGTCNEQLEHQEVA